MEKKTELTVTVISPARSKNLRKGSGFSLREIKESGIDVNQLKKLDINIDYLRKSLYPENIERLKNLEIIESDRVKKKPFVKKEKKRTPYKPKVEKPKVVKKEVDEKPLEKLQVKKAVKRSKEEKIKPKKAEKITVEKKGFPLDNLSGLGAATAKKFVELGVECVEDLCKENPDELAPLIKGVSADRLKKWIEEGKELIK